MRTATLLLTALLTLLLAACGYQLRGATVVDWRLGAVYLQEQQSGDLAGEVRRQLTQSGVTLAGDARAADTAVTVSGETYDRRVLSVDPDTGKVREYELEIAAFLTVARADGTLLLEREQIALQRDYVFEEGTALGSFAEEETLRADLREDAAHAIFRRLKALGSHAAVKTTALTP